jgi:hypothetical protein
MEISPTLRWGIRPESPKNVTTSTSSDKNQPNV